MKTSGRKNLGMGLDMLLRPSAGGQGREEQALEEAKSFFKKAQYMDEKGQELEAYYYYRRVIDAIGSGTFREKGKVNELLSRAYNNAAVIMFEHGVIEEARAYLEKALQSNPRNKVAGENLQAVESDGAEAADENEFSG